MKYAYLLKYKVSYVYETKYKLFSTIENAINFHRNYKHQILTDSYNSQKKSTTCIYYTLWNISNGIRYKYKK